MYNNTHVTITIREVVILQLYDHPSLVIQFITHINVIFRDIIIIGMRFEEISNTI